MAQESKEDTASIQAIFNIDKDTTKHEVLGDSPTVEKAGDTTKIRLGKKGITIVEKDGKTTVNIDNIDGEKDKSDESSDKKDDDKNFDDWGDFGHKWDKHKSKGFKPHFAGIDLFFNNYVNSKQSLQLRPEDKYMTLKATRSMGVNVNLFEFGIPFSTFTGLVTGLGMEFNSYYFSGKNNIQVDSGRIINKPFTIEGANYQKTKFRDTYLTIPLLYELQFERNTKRPLYISFGVIGGINIGSSTKEIYVKDESEIEHVVSGGININQFRYGFHAKIGYRYLNLFATYYPSPLFERNKGPELYPFNIGLTLVSF
jgi:hypothetical protein